MLVQEKIMDCCAAEQQAVYVAMSKLVDKLQTVLIQEGLNPIEEYKRLKAQVEEDGASSGNCITAGLGLLAGRKDDRLDLAATLVKIYFTAVECGGVWPR